MFFAESRSLCFQGAFFVARHAGAVAFGEQKTQQSPCFQTFGVASSYNPRLLLQVNLVFLQVEWTNDQLRLEHPKL